MTGNESGTHEVHKNTENLSGEKTKLQNRETASVISSVTRILDITQRLIIDRFELARIETREDIAVMTKSIIMVLCALPLLLIGWFGIIAGLVIALNPYLSLWAILVIMGFLHFLAGGAGLYFGIKSLQKEEDSDEQEDVD